jgi:hypothetical protein
MNWPFRIPFEARKGDPDEEFSKSSESRPDAVDTLSGRRFFTSPSAPGPLADPLAIMGHARERFM